MNRGIGSGEPPLDRLHPARLDAGRRRRSGSSSEAGSSGPTSSRCSGSPDSCSSCVALVWVVLARPRLTVDGAADPRRLHVGDRPGRPRLQGDRRAIPRRCSTLSEASPTAGARARFLVAPIAPGDDGRAGVPDPHRTPRPARARVRACRGRRSVRAGAPRSRRGTGERGARAPTCAQHRAADARRRAPPRARRRSQPTGRGHRRERRVPRRAPYEIGDDLRRVHWRSSARTGDIMVRQNEAPRRGATLVVLDTRGHRDLPLANDGSEAAALDLAFEGAVEAAASIVTCLQRSRRPVECCTSAGVMLDTRAHRHRADRARPAGHGHRRRSRRPRGRPRRAPPPPARARGLRDGRPRRRRGRRARARAGRGAPSSSCCTGGALTPARLRIVDARLEPFPDAWRTARRPNPSVHKSVMDLRRTLAPTCRARRAERGGRRRLRARHLGDAWVAPVLGAAIAPHAIGPGHAAAQHRGDGRRVGRRHRRVRPLGAAAVDDHGSAFPRARTSTCSAHRLDAGSSHCATTPRRWPRIRGVILLAVIAVWIMAAFADRLAFRRDATIGALAPGITLFIWIAALARPCRQPVGAAAARRDHRRRVPRVQTPAAARPPPHGGRLPTQRFAAPRLVAGAAAARRRRRVVAVALAPTLPGAGADPLVDLRNDDRGVVDATGPRSRRSSTSARSLRRGDRVELFTVAAASPDYWRIAALDEYSDDGGGQWTLSAAGDDITHGLDGTDPAPTVTQQYRIGPLGERWMPAAFEPVAVSLDDTLVVESSRTLVTDRRRRRPALQGRLPAATVATSPTPSVGRRARRCLPNSARYTELPPSLPADVATLARDRDRRAPRPVRQGGGAPRLLPRSDSSPTTRRRPRRRGRRDRRVPRHQARVLRAVREHVRADGPQPRHPRPGRGRLHARRARPRHRALLRDELRRARVARDLARRRRLDPPVRPDAPEHAARAAAICPHDTAPRRADHPTPPGTTPPTTPQPAPPDTGGAERRAGARAAHRTRLRRAPRRPSGRGPRRCCGSSLVSCCSSGRSSRPCSSPSTRRGRARQRRADPADRGRRGVGRGARPAPRARPARATHEHARRARACGDDGRRRTGGRVACCSWPARTPRPSSAPSRSPTTDADAAWHDLDEFLTRSAATSPSPRAVRARLRIAPLRRARASVNQRRSGESGGAGGRLGARSSATND